MNDDGGVLVHRSLGVLEQKFGGDLLGLQHVLGQGGDVSRQRGTLVGDLLLLGLDPRRNEINDAEKQNAADPQHGDAPAQAETE